MPNTGTINGGNGSYVTPKKRKEQQLDEADSYTYPEPHVDDYNKMSEKHNKKYTPKE